MTAEDELAELRAWVTQLEQRINELSGMWRAVDRDLADVQSRHRAIVGTLHALRETQVDHSKVLAAHTVTLARQTTTLTRLSEAVDYLVDREREREQRE